MRPGKVKDIVLKKDLTVKELFQGFKDIGGFTAAKLYRAYEILGAMIKDNGCTKFLSFPACIIATGTRGAIIEALSRKWFDVVVTTVGTLDHDIARALGSYYKGSFLLDDEELARKGLFRIGNVVAPKEAYSDAVEQFMGELIEEITEKYPKGIATHELVWEIGRKLGEMGYKATVSYVAWKNRIPVVIPGPYDGAVGFHLWLHQQEGKLPLNLFKDEKLLADIVFNAEKTGALIVGGGISKHHVIWWNQFKDGLDYAVYITTAVEWDGSLSGARPREAVSWHKIKPRAPKVTVEGDATVLLPLLFAALL